MNPSARDPLFINSRIDGGVESIELSTRPGDLAPAQAQPRRRRSDKLLARAPRLMVGAVFVGALVALLVWPLMPVFA